MTSCSRIPVNKKNSYHTRSSASQAAYYGIAGKYTGTATGPSSRGALLAQNAEQPELERGDWVDEVSSGLRSNFRCCDQSCISPTGEQQAIAML